MIFRFTHRIEYQYAVCSIMSIHHYNIYLHLDGGDLSV